MGPRLQRLVARIGFAALAALASAPAWPDTIRVNPPNPYVAEKAVIEKAAEVGRRAAAVASRVYANRFAVSYGESPARPTYTVDIVPVLSAEFSMLTVTMKRTADGTAGGSEAIYGAFDEGMARSLASLLYAQWALMDGEAAAPSGQEPRLVQELPADALSRTLLPPGMPSYLAPFGVAVRQNGNVVVGFGSVAAELDRWLRVVGVPGRSLLEGGNYTSSYGVAVTPADTLFLKPASGREIFKVTVGSTRPARVRVTVETSGAFAALPDGSFVLADWQQKKAYRFDGQKAMELPLFSGQWSYLSAMAAGPEGTLWVCDSNLRSVRIYSPRGELLDVIVPVIDAVSAGMPMSMAVYEDGSFLLQSSSGHLSRYRRDGTPVWRIRQIAGGGAIPMQAGVAVDSTTGSVYLADYAGKRVLKLLDLSYRSDHRMQGGPEEEILALDGDAATMKKADLYEQNGAFEVARYLLEGALDANPANDEAARRIDRLEVAILAASAATSRDRTLELLTTLGPASARATYDATMALYEQILRVSPDEAGVLDAKTELERRFREKASGEGRPLPLTVVSLELTNIFPALMQSYRENPVGYVTVKNTLSEEVRNVRATTFIMRYCDYPAEAAPVVSLKPGEIARIGLPLLLNTQVLDLQEDLAVQVQVAVSYDAGGQGQQTSKAGSLTIYRRTALSWDDSGKLASFITPNESTVATFALRVSEGAAGVVGRLPSRLLRAMRICDALGAYGITYVEDPDSPISRVLGKSEAIDTVRFPRMTMVVKSGDCDDTTALLGSLLESAGIATAILTTPGHVFLAFDSAEPAANGWLFDVPGYTTIERGGSVWIPVETTALKKGFFGAWASASELVRRYDPAKQLEMLMVSEERSRYPALPLAETSFSVVEPSAEEILPLWKATTLAVGSTLYQGRIADLAKELGGESGTRAVKTRNKMAALHARFGGDREAEATLLSCIVDQPDFVASYVNLGSLYLATGRNTDARAVLEKARSRRPDATLVNLLLAECMYDQGDAADARTVYREVRAAAPELADKYAYLGGGDDTARAANPGERPTPIWDAGD